MWKNNRCWALQIQWYLLYKASSTASWKRNTYRAFLCKIRFYPQGLCLFSNLSFLQGLFKPQVSFLVLFLTQMARRSFGFFMNSTSVPNIQKKKLEVGKSSSDLPHFCTTTRLFLTVHSTVCCSVWFKWPKQWKLLCFSRLSSLNYKILLLRNITLDYVFRWCFDSNKILLVILIWIGGNVLCCTAGKWPRVP